MYVLGDDISWTRAKHAFKGGFEFRNTMSKGFGDPAFTPYATFGAGNYIGCSACGRLIKIEWAVRSLVCSCGARVNLGPPDGK